MDEFSRKTVQLMTRKTEIWDDEFFRISQEGLKWHFDPFPAGVGGLINPKSFNLSHFRP